MPCNSELNGVEAGSVRGCGTSDPRDALTSHPCYTFDHVADEGRLIPLASKGGRCKVRRVRFYENSVARDGSYRVRTIIFGKGDDPGEGHVTVLCKASFQKLQARRETVEYEAE